MRPGRVDSLQILRFLAAFLVVVGHSQHGLVEHLGGATGAGVPSGDANSGVAVAGAVDPGVMAAGVGRWGFIPFDWGLGVDVFFVISGFVMFYMMHDRFGRAGAARDFLRRRIIRVVPLYWLFTSVAVLAMVVAHDPLPGTANIVYSYLFLPGPACGEYCLPVFTLGWTLNYEMMFYLIFAVGLMFRRTTGLALVFGAILGLMALARIAPADWRMLGFWGYPLTGEFLAGIVLAHLFLSGVRIGQVPAILCIVLAMVVAVIGYQTGAYDTIGRIVTGGIPATLIMAAAVLGLEPWIAGRRDAGAMRLLIAGGNASYALYLSHPIAIKVAEAIGGRLNLFARAPALFLALAIVGAVVGSAIVHQFIEKPLLRVLNRRWSRLGSTGLGDGQPAPGRAGVIVSDITAERGTR